MELPTEIQALLDSKNVVPSDAILKIPLFASDVPRHSFQSFLIEQRFRPTQILQVLQELGMEKTYLVGYEQIALMQSAHEEDEPDTLIKTLGPTLLEKEFTGEELFQSILSRFGIAQVVANDLVENNLKWELRESINEGRNYVSQEREHIILATPFIVLAQDAIYTTDKELAQTINRQILAHTETFNELLHSDLTHLSHDNYIRWFLTWFPGLIRINSISDQHDKDEFNT